MNTKAPTVAEEMAKFSGFTTNNGETVAKENTITSPATTDLSDDERKAGMKIAGGKEARNETKSDDKSGKPAKVELTEEEADAAVDAARAALEEGEELTPEEEADAIAAALTEKQSKAAKPGNGDRVKRAQEGRRRAEARAARAERRADALEARMAALETGGVKNVPLTGNKDEPKEDKEPDPTKFEFGEVDPKFVRALARWEVRQELAAASKTQETKQRTSAEDRAAAEFTAKKEAFEDAGLSSFDDFQEVVMDTVGLPKSDPAAWPLSATVGRLLLESEFGPQIAYALASDPKEAKRVDKLTSAEQQRWFFRQEAKLEAEAPKEDGEQDEAEGNKVAAREAPKAAAKVTRAPPPPRRNNGGSGNKSVNSATTDFAAFEAMANQAPAKR